jgi:hypothetical protein
MGFIADQDGIMTRYINESGEWNNHLNHTKNFIIECLSEAKPRSIAILGSGWLLDIPVSYLAESFDEVFFYDLRHPKAIKHKYRKQANFRFIEMDLTGGIIEQVFRLVSSKKKYSPAEFITQLQIPSIFLQYPAEYIISINILSQIDSLIIDYIRKHTSLTEDLEFQFRKELQLKHIELLRTGKSCLITDYEEINLDINMNDIAFRPLIFAEVPKGVLQEEWVWNFDTRMTYHSNCITRFKVKAEKF